MFPDRLLSTQQVAQADQSKRVRSTCGPPSVDFGHRRCGKARGLADPASLALEQPRGTGASAALARRARRHFVPPVCPKREVRRNVSAVLAYNSLVLNDYIEKAESDMA